MRICPAFLFCAALAVNCSQAATLTVTPSSISNTYTGTITLQVGGIASGETVVIQKFLDANTNGVVDVGDGLSQQFRLTDGQATVFHDGATSVTNLNVPGDLDSTTGQITAILNLAVSGFEQTIAGKYLFKLSSPIGSFSPITNSFAVTNFPFAQSFSGNVVANGTNVPGAIVLLFEPLPKGDVNPKGGVVADNSGHYSAPALPGTYLVVPFRSNFVANVGAAPALILGSGASITTNVDLISASRYISGSVVDASNAAVGLPGMLTPISSQNGLLTVAFTDTNGNFTAGVTPDKWKIEGGDGPIAFHGYLRAQDKAQADTTSVNVSNVNIALPKATAMFYGSIKNDLNQAMPGINLFSNDSNNYEQNVISDLNGNYFAGALSGELWGIAIDSQSNPTNVVFSEPSLFPGTNLSFGQALHINFTALPATNRITGHVQQSSGQPISGVQIFASAIIGPNFYATRVVTDTNGDYSLNVANLGNWNVSVSCQGGDDSLDYIVGGGTYVCPNTRLITISNNNGVANFTIQLCGGIQIANISPLPSGTVGVYYSQQFSASSCNGNFNWSTNGGTVPPGLTLYPGGPLNGTPTTNGTFNFTIHVSDNGGASTNQTFSLTINSPPTSPTITAPARLSNSQFQMTVNGSSGLNYTVQMSTNLASTNWTTLLITNPPTTSFLFKDTSATNAARFYRVFGP
jgi:hypothetical protein